MPWMDDPQPILVGTIALYPMPDGGVMSVLHVPSGAMAGTKRLRMGPGMLRTISLAVGGGPRPLRAIRERFGRRRAITATEETNNG